MMRFWMQLSNYPVRLFGDLTGASIHAAEKRYAQVKAKAEFDETLVDTRDRLLSELKVAWARTVATYLCVAAVIYVISER